MANQAVSDIIDLWPSLTDFAGDAGVSYGAAKQMRRRGSIPARYFAAIVAAAQRRHLPVTDARLSAAHAGSVLPEESESTPDAPFSRTSEVAA